MFVYGQLNRPNYPTSIPGFGTFAGLAFHSARWDADVDLAGMRVAVNPAVPASAGHDGDDR